MQMWYVRLGGNLRGPFTEEQLRQLRKRGELSTVHQVSSDRQTWQSASELFMQWQLAERERTQPQSSSQPQADLKDDSKGSAAPVADAWYFASPNGDRVGPMSREQLIQLAAFGQINGRTLVYGPGLTDWAAASSVGFLRARGSSRGLALPIALVACLSFLVLGACAYAIYVYKESTHGVGLLDSSTSSDLSGSPTATSGGLTARPPNVGKASKITSIDQVGESIARVQIIERISFDNGSVVERPASHGTGFCVTPTGYFLTNRHVVESFAATPKVGTLEVGGSAQTVKKDMSIVLFLRGIRFEAQLVHVSSRFDLAIVKITRIKALPYFELSADASPGLLTDVIALGFPGVAATPSKSEEAGIAANFTSEFVRAVSEKCLVSAENQLPLSSFGHSAVPGSITKTDRTDNGQLFVFHSAAIFGGNSGGPLINKRGTVIGINTAIRRDLDVTELTLSDGSKSIMAINDGNLNQAFLISQFRDELNEYLPEQLHWK
jgi:S1-C subfamily serine protease